MAITVAVTGGIGAGKSTVSGFLAERGAIVVDSDRMAREVVAIGTPGLAAVAEHFGPAVIAADGSLDRAALAGIVFADPAARRVLESITHPLVRAGADAARRSAPPGSVVVNDIPLLTTAEAAGRFHLVIGVGAPESVRVGRLIGRGLGEQDARSRIAVQIDDEARRLICDVWVDNAGGRAPAERQVEELWPRLVGYAANVEHGAFAVRGGPAIVPYDPGWPATAARVMARVRAAVGDSRVDHIGSTAVPGFPAKDVIDLQLTVTDLGQADGFAGLLAAAGLPLREGFTQDTPHPVDPSDPSGADPARWGKRVHVNADPGLSVNLHLRVRDWPNWVWALRFRDWLRSDDSGRADYLAVKEDLAASHGEDSTVAGYADAKEEFLAASDARILAWARATGWTPA
ncbi:dephospho-CoA kinase [Nakamurella sp. UYEF19]|uniref:dephospho-CoA kinase n=1 Tax=Nakamurella sp. UYEF19 TaxID=1756392 RepID=UPI003395D857